MNDVSEKEIIHKIDMVTPEYFYIKPMMAGGRFGEILFEVFLLILTVESVIVVFMLPSRVRFVALLILIYYLYHLVKKYLIVPRELSKYYQKLHSENEDSCTFTLYSDCVVGKTSSTEVNLSYSNVLGWVEEKNRLALLFSCDRFFVFDTAQCTDEQISFIKNIVPYPKQRKFERKCTAKFAVVLIFFILLVTFGGVIIGMSNHVSRNTYYVNCPSSTYESFVACLEYGTVEDVLIINKSYVEYTFTGDDENKRYCTKCSDDIGSLIQLLEEENVEWEIREGLYLKTES